MDYFECEKNVYNFFTYNFNIFHFFHHDFCQQFLKIQKNLEFDAVFDVIQSNLPLDKFGPNYQLREG